MILKTLFRFAPLFLSAFLIGCAQNPAKSGGAGAFAPSGGGFTVNMPAAPKAQTASHGTRVYTTEVEGRAYIVSYTDLGSSDKHLNDAQIGRVLNGAIKGVTSNGSHLLSRKNIHMDGHAARDLRLRLKSGHFMRLRITLVGRRLFQVGVVTDMKDSHAPQIRKFLRSFHITMQ